MAKPERFLLAGVMGWPVMHSRSPMLHNYWFARHKLAGTYIPLAIRPEGLAGALRALQPLCNDDFVLLSGDDQSCVEAMRHGARGVIALEIGVSRDEALRYLEDEAAKILPKGYVIDYTGESRQLRTEGDRFLPAFNLAVILIFLARFPEK